jgi:hypothetical protein
MAAVMCVSCGFAIPQQSTGTQGSPLATPTRAIATVPTPSPTAPPAAPIDPSITSNTRATSLAVYATITALAASPTYSPTSTPRPYRTPISAGPEVNDIPPTALYTSGGIGVLTISTQVMPGGAAALTIKAKPAAVCTLKIDRSTANAASLEPIPSGATRVAGREGVTSWIWNIEASEPAGIMRLVADCGDAGMAQLQLKVVK